jgi:hypothetical protein
MKGNGINKIMLAMALAASVGTISCTKEKRVTKTVPAKQIDEPIDNGDKQGAVGIVIRDQDKLGSLVQGGVLMLDLELQGQVAGDVDLYCAIALDSAAKPIPCSGGNRHEARDLVAGKTYYVRVVAVDRATGRELAVQTTTFTVAGKTGTLAIPAQELAKLEGKYSGWVDLGLENPDGLDIRCDLEDVQCGASGIRLNLDHPNLQGNQKLLVKGYRGDMLVVSQLVSFCGGRCETSNAVFFGDSFDWEVMLGFGYNVLVPEGMHVLNYAQGNQAFAGDDIVSWEIMNDELSAPNENCRYNDSDDGQGDVILVKNPDGTTRSYCKAYLSKSEYKDQTGKAAFNSIEFSSPPEFIAAGADGPYERFEIQTYEEGKETVKKPAYKKLMTHCFTDGTVRADIIAKFWNVNKSVESGFRFADIKICHSVAPFGINSQPIWVAGIKYVNTSSDIHVPQTLEITFAATESTLEGVHRIRFSAADPSPFIALTIERIRDIMRESVLNNDDFTDYNP